MRSSRTIAAVGLALLVVLAGCGGMTGSDSAAPGGADGGGAADRADGGDSGGGSGGGGDAGRSYEADVDGDAVVHQRMVIRTGEVTLTVDDYEQTRASLTTMARDRGGYVSDSTQQTHRRDNVTWTTGQVVLRVPGDEFSDAVEEVKDHGQVESASTSSEDVTDQLVDIEARLDNLRSERDRLRTLYEEANETEDVLRVSRELSEVQEEIERLEARQRQLESQVQFATITVQIDEEPESAPRPESQAWWETGVLTAFLSSVSGVITVVQALVVGTAYVAPYVIAFGMPVAALAFLGWHRVSR